MFFEDLFNGIGDALGGLFGAGNGSPIQGIKDPSAWWEQFKNGQTNEINKEIAEENLEYQRERAAIEDERYEEETAYNREFAENERDYQREMAADERNYQREMDEYKQAFAEDERDYQRQFAENEREYNRALQERLFEREDTALERQASSLSKLGINPLSQQLNGLGAGSVVSTSAPSAAAAPSIGSSGAASSSAPSASSRGGQALHNDFQYKDIGMIQALGSLSSLADTINGVSTGQYQRDALALQNDAQFLKNIKNAHDLGFKNYTVGIIGRGSNSSNYEKTMGSDYNFKTSLGSAYVEGADKQREFLHKRNADMYNTDSPQGRLIKDLGNLDFVNLAENILTRGAKLADNIGDKFNKDFGVNNTLKKFFSLFY